MKIKTLILNLALMMALTFAGCKAQKPVSEITKTDTVTLIKERPIKIEIKADTATITTAMDTLYHQFKDAPNGSIIAQKKGKNNTSVWIKKGVKGELVIEGNSAAKDTTVYVRDTNTKITANTEKIYEKKPSWFQQQFTEIKDWLFWLVFLLIATYLTYRWYKH